MTHKITDAEFKVIEDPGSPPAMRFGPESDPVERAIFWLWVGMIGFGFLAACLFEGL